MRIIHREKMKFIAKNVTDLGKGIFVVGLAGYFFEKFPFSLRIALGILSIVLIITGIIIFPDGGEA